MGFEVLGPHINYSYQDYTAENGGIRIGLLAVNGIGPRFCERILRERENGPFVSIKEFCLRDNLPQDIILRLSLAGAFLGLPFLDFGLGTEDFNSTIRNQKSEIQNALSRKQACG